jgi:two-component system, response regulator, stage 0 sporulation protein F
MPTEDRRGRILVVDDDAGIRALLQLALASRGYTVDCVANHEDAWTSTPDLVLLDARLGRYTAADFLAAARLGEGTSVVLMTAGDDIHSVASDLGVEGAIAKPFDLDELFDVVERHLSVESDGQD